MLVAMNDSPTKETSNNITSSSQVSTSNHKEGAVPSGFILKLFQMVNGAPDEIISWTPDGDAFKIGADLYKLESETLPQYFRHSRFQSLVRQLNFYNFRKVNRERTFWIYKHKLFHRDHPENLHLLRRRTCPGVDGRKNRFTGYTTGRNGSATANANNDTANVERGGATVSTLVNRVQQSSEEEEEEDSSVEEEEEEEQQQQLRPPQQQHTQSSSLLKRSKKRSLASNNGRSSESKRSKKKEKILEEKKDDDEIDLDLSSMAKQPKKKIDDDLLTSDVKTLPKVSQPDQSHVVHQVAMKLEEYARKARRGLGSGGRGGIVTPPLGGGHLPSGYYYRSLLTYDDEYEITERRMSSNGTIVTDCDGVSSDDEGRDATKVGGPIPTTASSAVNNELFDKPPVQDEAILINVTKRIMESEDLKPSARLASAALISFCMSTAPQGEGLFHKILQLTSACNNLGEEFQRYRAALHPSNNSTTSVSFTFEESSLPKNQGTLSVHQIWDSVSCRNEAVRDFKVFAVNCISHGLKKSPNPVHFSEAEHAALCYTSEMWLKSSTN